MLDRTMRCPICGMPYVFYSFYAGDQSACRRCKTLARQDESELRPPWFEPPSPSTPRSHRKDE